MNRILNTKLCEILNKGFYVIEFIISILVGVLLFQIICDKLYVSIIKVQNIIVCTVLALILIAMIIIKLKKEYKCYEKIFLTLMIPIGLFYLIFLIPGHVPDEHKHITRIADISQGNLFVNINEQEQHVPLQISKLDIRKIRYNTLLERIQKQQNYSKIDERSIYNSFWTYFPIVYLIPSLIFKLGIMVNCNFFVMIYLARMANFILTLTIGYYAIKKIPVGKLLLLTYLFNPMYIQQSISLSADCFINGFIILFISYTFYLIFKKEEMSLKDKVIYAMLFIVAFLNKTVYYPISLIALLLVIGKNKREKKSERSLIIICMISLTVVTIAWAIFGMNYVDVREYVIKNNVNSKEQIMYILKNPIEYMKIIINNVMRNKKIYMKQFLGVYLGLRDISTSKLCSKILLLMMLGAPFLEKNKEKYLGNRQKAYLILMAVGSSLLVITALYLIWSGVGENKISGVQGRYFIPIILLPLLCLIQSDRYKEFKYTKLIYIILIFLINMISLYHVIRYLSIPYFG